MDDIRNELCAVLNERIKLVTIFDFDSERHNGNLEEAMLDAVFSGLLLVENVNS